MFENLPHQYPVYLIYYPGAEINEETQNLLRQIGSATGENLYVSIGRLNDNSYNQFCGAFGIGKLPVLIMTAKADLAATADDPANLFVRIDSDRLLASPDLTRRCVEHLLNLFLSGDINKVEAVARGYRRKATLGSVLGVIRSALGQVGDFVAERDFTISWLEGRLEIRRSG